MRSAPADTATSLFAVFDDIHHLKLEGASRVDLLREFGSKLIARTRARNVEFVIADVPDGDSDTAPDDVTVIELPCGDVRTAQRESSWWKSHFGWGLTDPGLRGVLATTANEDGSTELIVPVRFMFCYGLVRVTATGSERSNPDQWAVGLDALTESLGFRWQGVKKQERQDFFRKLATASLEQDPSSTLDFVCKQWQELSGATYVWVWLWNEHSKKYELAACEGEPPQANFEPGPDSASAYAVDANRIVIARGDFAKWQREYRKKTYRIEFASETKGQVECHALACIPIVLPEPAEGIAETAGWALPRIRGTICLHYRDSYAAPEQPNDSLRIMGQQSAIAILTAFLLEQRRSLLALTQMSQRHLTRISRRPEQVRAEYLKELIDLIQRTCHTKTVSIFYRRPFGEAVECIATTGIAQLDGARLADDRLFVAVYKKGEGRTGQCFRDAVPFVLGYENSDPDHRPIYVDLDPDTNTRSKSAVIYPIYQHSASNPQSAIGVIRCGRYQPPSKGDSSGRTSLHPIHVQTLEFIAYHVGPLLQIFENSILRERTISTVKHDLFSNLNMVRDTAERIKRDLSKDRPVRECDLNNLGMSRLLATNLVVQLDAEPGMMTEYNPIPTLLVGDILARVVDMLQHYAVTERNMNIEYSEDIKKVIPELMLDRALIERVILNLLVNAVKYGEPNSIIRITARSTHNGGFGRTGDERRGRPGYYLNIENHGLGIDDDDADLVGRPGFRAKNARGAALGIGLGIYIARKAMEQHGGELILTRHRSPTIFSMFFPSCLVR